MNTRRKRSDDKSVSGRDLWTAEGTRALIRKLQSDPGLTEEFRKQAIESVRSGAVEKGIPVDGRVPVQASAPQEVTVTAPTNPTPAPTIPPEPKPPTVEFSEAQAVEAGISFDAYQAFTNTVALYPKDVALPYTTLGLNGEPGEVAAKVAAIISKTLLATEGAAVDEKRDTMFQLHNLLKQISKISAEAEKLKKALRKGEKKIPPIRKLTDEEKTEIALELGDVLWYVAQTAETLGIPLSQVADSNVKKLRSRKERGVIQGNGDNR